MKRLLFISITVISIIFAIVNFAMAEDADVISTGPALAAEICNENGIAATPQEIAQLSASDKGVVSFKGLNTALSKKGLRSSGLKADSLDQLSEFTQKGYCLVILSKNRIYVRVRNISNDFVEIHNPSTYPKSDSIPRAVFEGEWDGTFLFIERASVHSSLLNRNTHLKVLVSNYLGKIKFFGLNYIGIAHAAQGVTALTDTQMQAAQGGNPCKNPNGDPGPQPDEETEDPVILTNGNLHSTETDFSIEARGLIPLELTRTYNSQVVSYIEGWQPETASGPWAVRDGVYGGFGDRTFTTRSFMNFTLTADIKTVLPGTNAWETAWIDFRCKDEENRCYFLIKKDGSLEFTKMKNGQMTQQQKSSCHNPLNWNTIKIIANNSNIKIYVNNNLEFNYNDPDPLYEANPIGLEARFSYAQFDNISIQSGAENYSYNFNTPDRTEPFGRGWSFNYGMSVKTCSNGDARVIKEDGRSDLFTKNSNGTYTSPAWLYETLTKDASGWTLRQKDGTKYAFDAAGRFIYIEDRFKNRNTLYYEGNLLKKVIDPSGRKFTFEYDSDGRITKAIDPKGNKYEYIYDGINLTQVIDPRGSSRYYEYSPVTNLRTAYIDREGNKYEYTHSYNARIIEQKDPELNRTTFEYWWDTTHVVNRDNETWYYRFYTDTHTLDDITDNLGTVTDYIWDNQNNLTQLNEVYGKTTKLEYDSKGNPVKIIDAENGASYPTILQYDPNYSLITYKKDPKGNETTFVYSSGMLTEIREPLAKTTTIAYYSYGKPKTITDAEGRLTEFEYDTYGYLKKIKRYIEAGYVEKTFTYDAVGNLLSETDEEGNITNYTYDANNNLLQVKASSGSVLASFTYDKNDNPASITDALGHIVYQEHDWAGNLTKITEYDELNTAYTTEYTYDNKDYLHLGKSDLIQVKDPEGNITTYQYVKETAGDGLRKLIIKTDAENHITKSQWTKLGYLAYIEDAAAKKTNYSFDYLGRVKTVSYPDSSSEGYTYDRAGNLATKRDRKWQTLTYQYDALNRPTKKLYPNSSAIDYTYDKVNNLKTVIDSTGTTTLNYDKLNRLISAVYPAGKTVTYEYYRNGLRKKLTYPDSSYIMYYYDTLKRLIDIRDSLNNLITRYTYDGISNRRKSIWYQNAAMMEYAYDALNRIKSIKNKTREGTIFSSFDYTYDKVGNRLTTTSKEGLCQYFYDDTYQLIDVTYPDQRTGHYEYDVMGNRVYVDDRGEALDYTLKTNGLNQYDAVSKTKHNIDVKGTVTGTSPTVKVNNVPAKISGTSYTAEDITLSSGANTLTATATNTGGTGTATSNVTLDTAADKLFTYDSNGSLTRSTFGTKQANYTYDYENRVSSITQTGLPSVTYKYDYLGRRIEKNIGGTITKYIYDGDNIIAEYDGSGILITKYIFGPNIDEPIKGLSPQGTVPERYYHFDGLGSVTDLSNTSGQQVEHYVYNPFGKTKIYNASGVKLSDSAYGNYYRFTARQWDTESSLYYYRARMYDPKLGRFLQADPVGYKADINLYRYCGNNSLNRVDPRGLEGTKKTGKTGHITITRYAYPHGIPLIIVTWNSGKYELTQEFMDWYFRNFGGVPEGYSAAFDWRSFFKTALDTFWPGGLGPIQTTETLGAVAENIPKVIIAEQEKYEDWGKLTGEWGKENPYSGLLGVTPHNAK